MRIVPRIPPPITMMNVSFRMGCNRPTQQRPTPNMTGKLPSMDTEPSRLTITAVDDRNLAVAGVIDSHTAGELLDRLNDLGTGNDVTLDLGKVDFIDSSGLRTIVTAHQNLDGEANKLHLKNVSAAVDRLFEITGLREHLHISAD